MKDKKLSKEEIAQIIQAKEVLSKIGKGSSINVKEICDELEISRKTAYAYNKNLKEKKEKVKIEEKENQDIVKENEMLKECLKKKETEVKFLSLFKKAFNEQKKMEKYSK